MILVTGAIEFIDGHLFLDPPVEAQEWARLCFIGCEGDGLIHIHCLACLRCYFKFISGDCGPQHLTIPFHLHTVGGPPGAACDLQNGLRRAEHDRSPFDLSLSRFQAGQPSQTFGDSPPIAQASEHRQAFPKLGFCQLEIFFILGDISQRVDEPGEVALVVYAAQKGFYLFLIGSRSIILAQCAGNLAQVVQGE